MNTQQRSTNNSQDQVLEAQKNQEITIPENGAIMDHTNLQATFLKRTMLYLSFLHLVMAVLTIYFAINRRAFKDFYRNYTQIEDGYAIFFLVLTPILLVYPLFLRQLAKKLKILNMLLLAVCIAFLVSFSLNYGYKVRNNYHDILVSMYMAMYSSTFGVTLMNMIKGEKVDYTIAVCAGLVLYVVQEILNTYVFKLHNPQLWIYGLAVGGQILLTVYICLDQEMMISRRKDFFMAEDGFLGMIHLHFDWLFWLWRDLFTRDPNADAIDVQQSLNNDKQTPIIRFDDGLNQDDQQEVDSAMKHDQNLNETIDTQAL